jgi:hypothetical protein
MSSGVSRMARMMGQLAKKQEPVTQKKGDKAMKMKKKMTAKKTKAYGKKKK